MESIRVVIHGALGKMGWAITGGLSRDPELSITGAVDKEAVNDHLYLPDGSKVLLSRNLDQVLKQGQPGVLVDFSVAEASLAAARLAARSGVHLVIGTTGLSPSDLTEIDRLARDGGVGAVVAPNFALGAVILVHLAKTASRFFDYAEIIESHHQEKVDAPSGTALATAKAMMVSRGKPFIHPEPKKETLAGTRGGETGGVAIHSVRLPGFVASQEVVFGGLGQTLSLRHDTTSRDCYVPGVVLAVKEVGKHRGLVHGLEKLLKLEASEGSS